MSLNTLMVKQAKGKDKRYSISDERGLSLEIAPNGGKWWRFRYCKNRKEYKLSLGTYPEISLAEARSKRDELRVRIAKGGNPVEESKEAKREVQRQSDFTFEKIARECVQKKSNQWTTEHAKLTLRRLEQNIFPYLGSRPIEQITPIELLEVLRRIEKRGALYALKRARGICNMVFRYAIASGICDRNPCADLHGALTPPPNNHFASITDPKKVGQLLRDMENCNANYTVYCALQIAPLFFVRPGELRHAEWSEFDFDTKEWRIPAHKMKMKTTHIVPLSTQTITILKDLHPLTSDGKYVFPSIRTRAYPMSENTITVAIRRIGYAKGEMTGHGFRSMASTLLNELGYNRDWIERQLAHSERNSVRAAYNYAEFLPERRKMMQEWADYLDELKKER